MLRYMKEMDKDLLNQNTLTTGIVKDFKTGLPIANTSITIYNSHNQEVCNTTSSDDGTFSVCNRHKGSLVKLIAHKSGYHYSYNSFLPENNQTNVNLDIDLKGI